MDHIDTILSQWNAQRPDLDVGAMGLIGRIKRVSHLLQVEMEKTQARHGLNLASFDVLATLRRAGEPYRLSAGELLASSLVTSGTITHRVDQLVKAGLVKRMKNPEDGRGVLISLTAKGRRVIDAAAGEHVQTQARLVEGLSDGQFDRLNRLLSQYLVVLES